MTSSDPNEAGIAGVLPAPASFSAEDKRSHLVQQVLDSVTSPHSKRAYRTGLEQLFSWWAATATAEPFGRPLVQRYRSQLEEQGKAPATVNRALAPLRKLSEGASFAGLLPAATPSAVRTLGKVNKGGRFVGQGMTAPAIYGVVLKYEKL